MVWAPWLALCFAFACPLWAGPEADKLSGELGFGSLGNLPPMRFELKETHRAPGELRGGLDFSSVTWPSSLTPDDQAAFKAALNISGSFEGDEGWGNITGNFDGQGLSLGLLNQCLGQGSLQPLLIRMRDQRFKTLEALFSPDHLESLLGMLAKWQSSAGIESAFPRLSLLDVPSDPYKPELTSANQASVSWALKNLYSGAHFEPVWKAELVALSNAPEYVSFQIAAALGYHERAAAYEEEIGVREFRAYLMLFDIVVQNGGLYPEDLSEYAAYVQAEPNATSAQKLEKLLALRLRHVKPKYVQDVKSRKRAIITGKGTVHGAVRDLPAEYSYDPLWPYR